MNRTEIVEFIESVRPEIRESGEPEQSLLKAARKVNLAPSQLEFSAQTLNTAQQLNFMEKKSGDRGAPFKLLDVPSMMADYVRHPEPAPLPKAASTKEATVEKRDGKYVLLSGEGKVLGTHDTAKEAWAQEYAIQKSKEREGEEKKASARVAYEDPELIPAGTGYRAPDINGMLARDTGKRASYIAAPEMPEDLPAAPRFVMRGADREKAANETERRDLANLEEWCTHQIKEAGDRLAFRARTEGDFNWAEARADAEAKGFGDAAATVEHYFSQLGGHRKPASLGAPARPQGVFLEDRHGVWGELAGVKENCERLTALRTYREHVKEALAAGVGQKPRHQDFPTDAEYDQAKREYEARRQAVYEYEMKSRADKDKREADNSKREEDARQAEEEQEKLDAELRGLVAPPLVAPPPGDHRALRALGSGASSLVGGVGQAVAKVPGPSRSLAFTEGLLGKLHALGPGKNETQEKIDEAADDVRTEATLQRLILTDPIIREADPDLVASLFTSIQSSNPQVARDPNLLRFALREALQYESLPLHTYKDLAESEKSKAQAGEAKGKETRDRYSTTD